MYSTFKPKNGNPNDVWCVLQKSVLCYRSPYTHRHENSNNNINLRMSSKASCCSYQELIINWDTSTHCTSFFVLKSGFETSQQVWWSATWCFEVLGIGSEICQKSSEKWWNHCSSSGWAVLFTAKINLQWTAGTILNSCIWIWIWILAYEFLDMNSCIWIITRLPATFEVFTTKGAIDKTVRTFVQLDRVQLFCCNITLNNKLISTRFWRRHSLHLWEHALMVFNG